MNKCKSLLYHAYTHTQAHIANTLVQITHTGTHSHAYINIVTHITHTHTCTNRHAYCIVMTIVIKPRINRHTIIHHTHAQAQITHMYKLRIRTREWRSQRNVQKDKTSFLPNNTEFFKPNNGMIYLGSTATTIPTTIKVNPDLVPDQPNLCCK